MKRTWGMILAWLAASGCGATLEQLQSRAALDLNCQPDAISARRVDNLTLIAAGCGKQAVYVQTCSGKGEGNCTWLLNSEIRSTTK
jgi:hypothetical protein